MKVYLYYCRRPFVFSNEALDMMGMPHHVTFLIGKKNRTVFIVPLKSHRSDIGMTKINEAVYRDGGAYMKAKQTE